ncbi:MAG: hypothetical protein AUG49_05960 [Catenulispora sp. 13_1_20CM_3_70_7]|nr:hypothetical protein [Catenulisporales bacterium]OLE27217.1 MAG: hypothetical protein AUG49_05960 [Catenulispora sp. 13_1_20CM_3_70_7]
MESARRLLRRWGRPWQLAVPILLVTMVVGWLASHPAPRFRAQAVMAVELPAIEQAKQDNPNPYADAKASLAATAALVAEGLSSDSSAADLHARGLAAGYSLTPRNSGTVQEPFYYLPRLDITADGPSVDRAAASLRILITAMNSDLIGLQDRAGVDPNDRVTTKMLVNPSTTLIPVRKTRALAGVAVIGGGAAWLVPAWLRNVGRRRGWAGSWA